MKKYLPLAIIFACFIFSCSTKKVEKEKKLVSKTLGTIITDSIAPPKVTKITEADAPKVIKAGKPIIIPLKHAYGVGVPHITHYGIPEGLPDNTIRALDCDRQGNIWIATAGGLSKYDGTEFTNYNSDNGLTSSSIRTLFIDSKNNIWVAAGDSLYIFNGRHFNKISFDKNTRRLNYVRKIIEDSGGSVWWGTNDGLFKYTANTITKFTIADGLLSNHISNITLQKNGGILISTSKGITRYDGNTFTPYTNISVNTVGESPVFYSDSKGNIWFNNGSGELGKFDGSEVKIYSKKDRGDNGYRSGLTSFLEDKSGNYWIGGFNEVTKFDGNRFIQYPTNDGLASFQIISLTEDENGNIWAGTQRNGVYKINGAYLSKLEIPAGIGLGIAIDKMNNKWIVTTEGLAKYNRDYITYYGKEKMRFGPTGLFIDHSGNKWFRAFDSNNKLSVVKFNDTIFSIFENDKIIQGSSVRIHEDKSGNIWFVSFTGGIVKFDGVSFSHYGAAQGLKPRFINSFFEDSKNNLWLGSDSGAYKYDGHRFSVYSTRDGLPSNNVNEVTEDDLGQLWFGTDGGASRFNGNSFTNYRTIDGLANVIRDVEYDSVNKVMWFDTRIGLATLSMEQVNEGKSLFQHYNPRTGFNFSTPRTLIIDKEGVVWVHDNGVSRFDYKSIKNSKPIPLHIKNVRLDNMNICWTSLRSGTYPSGTIDSLTAINEMVLKFGKSFSAEDFQMTSKAFGKVRHDSITGSDFIPVNLVLPIENNSISFEFGSISTSFGKAILYQYKLDGYDKNWSSLSTKTEASFGNMSEGNYTFHVKAFSPFGTWSETSYSFKVLPPWYRTWWAYTLYILFLGLAIFTFIRLRTKALQKEKTILEEKVNTRTSELEESLDNLKSTQSQLIQSEKMASLGELTAGIAHEIQNPLNFVNNFSEVNTELLVEMKEEMDKGNLTDAKEIANDVIANSEKINHHGKRAGDIVKGMLQHSRSSSGVKEPTDINALADENLRLAYHGLRAKDKSFNAIMKTDFDETIGNINIIPQDIGRVILNLITNAFYAVNEKATLRQAQGDSYHPTVSVSTKKEGNKVLISVKDNGNGIPPKILDKIFQPFFTTKPTGQGTGLGLSLSYDIVKAHGGEIKVDSKENEGTEFTIQLPTS